MEPSYNTLKECYNKGISLELIWLLQYIENGGDVDEISNNIPKFEGVKLSLLRKSYITEDYKLTMSGKELIKFLGSKEEVKLTKKKVKTENIDLFWSCFPSTDNFEYKGKKFIGSRALRTNKGECKNKLENIINTGEYKIEEIVEAIKLDVNQKKQMSYKTGQNKLSYLQNSLTYLRQLSFEPYLELIKQGHKIEEKQNTEYDGINI